MKLALIVYYGLVVIEAATGDYRKALAYATFLPCAMLAVFCFRVAWEIWRHPNRYRR